MVICVVCKKYRQPMSYQLTINENERVLIKHILTPVIFTIPIYNQSLRWCNIGLREYTLQ